MGFTTLIKILVEVLWFMLPAYGANMVPGLFRNTLMWLGKPVDFGKEWKGNRLLGNNKTFRGFVVGVLCAMLLASIQRIAYQTQSIKSISMIDYSQINPLVLGFLFGFGALFGDAAKSFFKRRLGIRPGARWIPFDQVDWVIGSLLFVSFFYVPDTAHLIMIIVLFPILHVIVNHIAFYLRIRETKW